MYTVTTQTVTDDLMGLSLLLSSAGTPVEANPVIGPQSVMPHSMIPGLLTQVGIDLDAYAQDLGYNDATDLYSNVGYLVYGQLDLANFLGETGAWDPAKVPSNPTVEPVGFYMTTPYVKDEMHPDFCEMPATGFPVVIFQHGLAGSKEHILTLANEFAKKCYITIAIDAVKHGERKVGENSGEGFFSPNLFASRDNLRQSVLDLVQLKAAVNIMADPGYSSSLPASVIFDKTKVSYFGISLGGILGTMFMTVSPDVNSGVLNVSGGGLIDILLMTQAPSIKAPIIDALAAQGIEEGTPAFAQFMFLGQLILDQADPIAYAHHTITNPLANETFTYASKNILMQKAIDDEVINNYTTDHLSQVMGIYSTEDTDSFKTYSPEGTYGSKHSFIAGNEVSGQTAREDIIDFYDSAFNPE